MGHRCTGNNHRTRPCQEHRACCHHVLTRSATICYDTTKRHKTQTTVSDLKPPRANHCYKQQQTMTQNAMQQYSDWCLLMCCSSIETTMMACVSAHAGPVCFCRTTTKALEPGSAAYTTPL